MPAPEWLDTETYPFAPHYFDAPAGRMHYVDAGAGAPVVFVHGNPSWSFQFREAIRALQSDHRCIAMDHLGFGLSDKPKDFSYLPVDHAHNLSLLLDSLDLHEVTLVVNDWGGPIGLSYALDNPDRIARLVITNTWMWSVRTDWYYQGFSGFMGSPLGRYLIGHRNFFANVVMRQAFGTKSRLTPEIHAQYLAPLATVDDRRGSWVFPRQIIGSSQWLASLWERRDALTGKEAALVWGMKDIAFREKELNRWIDLLTEPEVVRLDDVGHFLSEEAPQSLIRAIRGNTAAA